MGQGGSRPFARAKTRVWAEEEEDVRVTIEASALTCPICYNIFHKSPGILYCGHSVCRTCAKALMRNAQSTHFGLKVLECPICRAPSQLTSGTLPANYVLTAVLDSLATVAAEQGFPTLDPNLRYENSQLKAEAAAARSELAEAERGLAEARQREKTLRIVLLIALIAGLTRWITS